MDELFVRDVLSSEFPQWDDLIRQSSQGSVFLRSDFLQMLCQSDPTLNLKIIGCFTSKGDLRAGQALVYRNFLGIFIGYDSSFFYNGPILPLTNYDSRAQKAEIENTYLTLLGNEISRRFPHISHVTHPSITDLRPLIRLGWKANLHYTHVWHLEQDRDVWNRIRRCERRMIKTGEEKFTFNTECWNEVKVEFLRILKICYQRLGWTPGKTWIDIFCERMKWMDTHNISRIITARDRTGVLIGAIICIVSNEDHTAYFWKITYDPDYIKDGIMPALCYKSYQAVPEDCTRIDWEEGMTLGQSIFKDRMGTDLEPYYEIVPPGSQEHNLRYIRNARIRLNNKVGYFLNMLQGFQLNKDRLPESTDFRAIPHHADK